MLKSNVLLNLDISFLDILRFRRTVSLATYQGASIKDLRVFENFYVGKNICQR